MSSTPTTRLRLEKQGAGENNNTWGAPKLNTVLDLVDFAIGGRVAFNLSGSITLTATNYATDQARGMFLDVAGGSGGTITIPAVEKLYFLRNGTTGSVVVTTGGTTNATVPPLNSRWIITDGNNVYMDRAHDFGGEKGTGVATPTNSTDVANKAYVDNTAFASLAGALPGQTGHAGGALITDATNISWSAALGTAAFAVLGVAANDVVQLDASAKLPAVDGSALTNLPKSTGTLIRAQTDDAKFATAKALADAAAPVVNATATGSLTLDFSTGFNFDLTLTGNLTLTVPSNMTSGQSGVIFLTQDSTGSRTLTLNASIKKPLGIAPSLSTAPGAIDMLSYFVKGIVLYVSAIQKGFA